MTLVAIILTYNEGHHIAACIASVRWADRVIVVDSHSTDDTVDVARMSGAEVMQHPFEDYAQQRNMALNAVMGGADWVVFVDADERITPELGAEIRAAILQDGYAGFKMPRHNFIFGKLTLGAGWYPDYQLRVLKVGAANYDPAVRVHELVRLNGREGVLEHPIVHHNYRDARQFRDKQRRYTRYDAQIMYEQGSRPKPQNYILQPLRHFWWRFITLKGYRVGLHGLRLSGLMAWYELRKYLTLRTLWQKDDFR